LPTGAGVEDAGAVGGGGRLGQLVGSTVPQDSRVQPDRIAGVV
jgi:hypothetical protein